MVVVTSGGGGKGWVGSLEFRSWRFLEREEKKKKNDTKGGGDGCLEKRSWRWG